MARRPRNPSPAPADAPGQDAGAPTAVVGRALDELEQRYLGLMQISGEAVLIVCDGVIAFANPPAGELLGVPSATDLVGRALRDFIARGQRAGVQARLRALKQPGQTAGFIRWDLPGSDREAVSVEVAMHACAYRGRPAVQVLVRDLSEQRRLQAELVHLARFDALTDLSNRAYFLEQLDAAIARAERDGRALGVVRVGLDNFRAVNEAAGLHGGDIVLRRVAERLRDTATAGSALARLGGDEFGLVLEGLDGLEDAAAAARRLMDSLAEGIRFEGVEYFATVSVGVALFPLHAGRRDRLLTQSLQAMKFAKAHGGNRYQLYSEQLGLLDRGDAKRRATTVQRMLSLTPREREVLDLLVTGKASKMIAYLLGVSTRTVGIHRGRVMAKMHAESVAELVHMTLELHA